MGAVYENQKLRRNQKKKWVSTSTLLHETTAIIYTIVPIYTRTNSHQIYTCTSVEKFSPNGSFGQIGDLMQEV